MTYDRFYLRIERLDGNNVARHRKTVEVRLISDFAGPPALVAELRSHGVYIRFRNWSATSD